MSRWRSLRPNRPRLELIAHAYAADIERILEDECVIEAGSRHDRCDAVWEGRVQEFGLAGPMFRKSEFDASAGYPAAQIGFRAGHKRKDGIVQLILPLGKSDASRAVDKPAIEGPTESSSYR